MDKCLGVLVLLLCMVTIINARCKKVFDTSIQCLGGGDDVQMTCPPGHTISVEQVEYYITEEDDCPNAHQPGACSLGALTYRFQRMCEGVTERCSVNVEKKLDSSASNVCQGNIGAHYIAVDYTCVSKEETEIQSMSICDKATLTGSKLRIRSHPDILDTECQCKVTLTTELEVQFRRLSFMTSYPLTEVCGEHVAVDGSSSLQVCPRDWSHQDEDAVLKDCFLDDKEIMMGYRSNVNESHDVVFEVEAQVHQDESMTIECGLIPSQETMESLEPLPAPMSETDNTMSTRIIPIIVGCCVGAGVLLIIATVIILSRRRRDQNKDDSEIVESETGSNYAFVKDVYLDGTTSTRQVVAKDTLKSMPGSLGPAHKVQPPHV